MPAIDLARLKKQTVWLADLFDQPTEFLRQLRDVLDYYVDRTMRATQSASPVSVLPSYRTPPLVLQYMQQELGPQAEARPSEALNLADALWDFGYLETRLLAAYLLGRIPPQEERLLARLTAWSTQVRDPDVRASLLTHSLARLRRETPDRFLTLVSEWLHPARERLWTNGLRALLPLIGDSAYENLPPVFALVAPVIEAAPAMLQTDLLELIRGLYAASPTETTYFLKKLLGESQNPHTKVLMRRILSALPEELAISLRDLVRR